MKSSETSAGSVGGAHDALMSARTVRLLKLSIVVMTVLIAGGLIALVYGMKMQMNKLVDKPPVAQTLSFRLPAGAVLRSVAAADEAGGLWLHLETEDGQPQLILLNAKGQLVRTVRLNQTQ